MRLNVFQKVALAALIFTIILMFVGAVVRATGAGMGCPDWPKCWGKYIPPTSAEEIDAQDLPIQKYKDKAARYGRDPDEITAESVINEFNPVHTWTEFINRLCSLPIGVFTLLTVAVALIKERRWPLIVGSLFATFLVGLNAWMGRNIVYSGLHPGTITTHMALAMLLVCVQVYLVWRGRSTPWQVELHGRGSKILGWIALVAFLSILAEGVLGSQVREMTDALKKSHAMAPRSEWVTELETSWMYLVHRSFSWLVLLAAIGYWLTSQRMRVGGAGWHENVVLGAVFLQMFLGLLLSKVGILPIVQVLHIGISSVLVTVFFHWLLGYFAGQRRLRN